MGCRTIRYSRRSATRKESRFINHIYLFIYISLAILICPAIADDLPAGSSSESKSLEIISSIDDVYESINETNLLLSVIAQTNTPPGREELFVIGEVALSRLEKNLDGLYGDNQSAKLIDTGKLAGLYSDMSFAFGTQKIPVMLSRYEPPEEQISISDASSERALINASIQYEDRYEPILPTPRIYEVSEGYRESSGGVDVIWDY